MYTLCGDVKTRNVFLNGNLLDPKKSQDICNHSPDGFSWGYLGSGPSQLALSVLLEIESKEFASNYYHLFKEVVISKLPFNESFEITIDYETFLKEVARYVTHYSGQ